MVDTYVGEIRLWSCQRIPVNWHVCDGTLLELSNYQLLFSLIGNRYGGDGVVNFALPDLRGRVPVGRNSGSAPSGLTPYLLAQAGGSNSVTLNEAELPSHTHALFATTQAAASLDPAGNMLADPSDAFNSYVPYASAVAIRKMANKGLEPAGGGQAHENRMPSLALNYIIALEGLYPVPN